jgi:hypothetical protein
MRRQSPERVGAVQNIDLNRLGGPVSVVIERIETLTNSVVQVACA